MYSVSQMVDSILYSPSNEYSHAQDRSEAALQAYQGSMAQAVLNSVGYSDNG